jgi:HEPN domain-containing protein
MDRFVEASEWIKYADNDYDAAIILFSHRPQKLEIICYLSQQAAEKMLKAFLVYSNVKPPKKHELDELCSMCKDIDASFEEMFTLCDRLNPYANQPRYPFGLEISESMMNLAIKDCETIAAFVKERISLDEVVNSNCSDEERLL